MLGPMGSKIKVRQLFFGVRIINLDVGSFLRMMPEKALGKAEKENKDKYLHTCLKCMCHFTLLVFSSESIIVSEATSAT